MPESTIVDRVATHALPVGARLRSLTWDDGDAVARLASRLGTADELGRWRQRLEPSGHGCPVAWGIEIEGRLVAQLLAHTRTDDFGLTAEVAWLELLGIDPAWQGHGLARLLAETFFEDCASRGVSRVATMVHLHNQPLRHFFRALGFRHSPLLCVERRV